jgi:hypothetical protein
MITAGRCFNISGILRNPPSAIQIITTAIIKKVRSQTDNGIKKAAAERVDV